MSEFKIEKGIPLVTPSRRPKYPWNDMEVGDSFFVECDGDSERIRKKQSSIYGAARKLRVLTRREGTGIRVWRIG